MKRFDVFLSYARADAIRARRVARSLTREGLSVFVDESGVHDFRSLTRLINTALGNSKVLVALYSKTYPQRPACQVELTLAYLAGQHEGDPRRRVIVVNPEDTTEHIHPVELRDAKHFSPPIASFVTQHVSTLDSPIGSVLPQSLPRWLPSPRLIPQDDSRLHDLWRLHTALHSHTATLVTGASTPGVAVLSGAAPRRLASSYAAKFSAAYPDGVLWFDHSDYERQIRDVVAVLDDRSPSSHLSVNLGRLAGHLTRPHLWVVDNVSPKAPPPLAPSLRGATLLITQAKGLENLGTSLDLAEPGDSMVLMSTLETPTERERLAAFDLQVELATRVGVQQLTAGGGSLREALTSLHSLFDTTRDVLHGYGPPIPSIHHRVEEIQTILRPFLDVWHQRLSAYEHRRVAETSAWEHEQLWNENAAMRAELAALQIPLREVVERLSKVSGSDLGMV